ncbi:MAG: transketolase family protein [Kiritimatiellae bacterium]|nr:transketolase family protein [Kiritimatiellia bacterium]
MKANEMLEMRVVFGDALVELGRVNERVVVLDADVGSSTQSIRFKKHFPERFYQVGVAEQNMMGIAAGLAASGFIPFASAFAAFAARKACDQVSISIAYPRLNVKINGGYGGVSTGKAGATHQAFEDLAIMRAIPNMTVIAPADAVETKQAVFAAAEHAGPVYLRTVRCAVPAVFEEGHEFRIGRSYTLREGKDITLISTGMMTAKVLKACGILKDEGISARVIHMPTLKPIDEAAIIRASCETGKIITVENHGVIGGLGSAAAEVLTAHAPCHLRRLGVQDSFGESGDDEAFFSKYGMNVENIVKCAEDFLSISPSERKQRD